MNHEEIYSVVLYELKDYSPGPRIKESFIFEIKYRIEIYSVVLFELKGYSPGPRLNNLLFLR
jgi:hypothetical protein